MSINSKKEIQLKIYEFILYDDLLGWDINRKYLSNLNKETIRNLWDITEGKCYKERIDFVKDSCDRLGKRFEPIEIEESFYMK